MPATGGGGGATVLVIDGHGAFRVDLVEGRAVPLTDAERTALAALPPMSSPARARLEAVPGHQPVHLRWSDATPRWFDPDAGDWVAVDLAGVDAVAASRTRPPAAAEAPQPTATPTSEPPSPRRDDPRWPVWPVEYHERPQPNLALGLVLSAAATSPTVREHYDLRPLGSCRPGTIGSALAEPAGILLFSHYVWSTRGNLRLSALAKEAQPGLITVHGGPNVPGYPDDVDRFLADHPHVDVLVHGEGEEALTEVLERLATAGAPGTDDPERLAVLDGVGGISFRVGDRIVRGPKRKRIADLDAAPSPYLSGVFDGLDLEGTLAVVETNRGCPFGCTFCDWGSATRSRVRMFDVDRVIAEIDWLAERGVDGIFVADANYGAFERDLPIAEAVGAARQRTGSPRQVMFTFAKDTAELLIPIVDLLWDAGVDVDGNLALQTVDAPTLQIVRRKNLPPPEYRKVRRQFRDRGLPLTSDIMLGLPGATYASMRADVQFCLDHEITPRCHRTVLLPNAPMSAPAHRDEHGIVADRLQRTVSGRTFSADDVVRAANLHRLADAFDHYGIARLPLRFAHRDHGIPEVDLLERLDELSRTEADRWPALAWGAVGFTSWMVPPGSWTVFLAELHRWLVDEVGLPDDAPLASVLAAQGAVLPGGAPFPRTVELAHDVLAWLARQHDRDEDPADPGHRPLVDFGPTILAVDDRGTADDLLVANRQSRSHTGRALREVRRIYGPSWELDSPLARAEMLSVEAHAFRFAE